MATLPAHKILPRPKVDVHVPLPVHRTSCDSSWPKTLSNACYATASAIFRTTGELKGPQKEPKYDSQ
eukprot:1569649-Amphidinium_carterae.1